MSAPRIGFYFVPMPQEIWDQNIELSLAEFRLYGYLIRHQLRIGEAIPSISHDELLNGIWTKKDGKSARLDSGCGVSRNSLKQAIIDLRNRGWITLENISDNPNMPRLAIKVRLSVSDRLVSTADTPDVNSSHPECQSLTPKTAAIKEVEVVEGVEVKTNAQTSIEVHAVFSLPVVGSGKPWPVTQEVYDAWTRAYPGINVMAELEKATAWLVSNPRRGKTARGMSKFANSWLSRAQDNLTRHGDPNGNRQGYTPPAIVRADVASAVLSRSLQREDDREQAEKDQGGNYATSFGDDGDT